jgi:hypothetical protein
VRRSPAPGPLSGDFSEGETHVPIPNTIVKPLGPMIVLKGAKVGHRRDHLQAARSRKTVSRLSFEPLLARRILSRRSDVSVCIVAGPR